MIKEKNKLFMDNEIIYTQKKLRESLNYQIYKTVHWGVGYTINEKNPVSCLHSSDNQLIE